MLIALFSLLFHFFFSCKNIIHNCSNLSAREKKNHPPTLGNCTYQNKRADRVCDRGRRPWIRSARLRSTSAPSEGRAGPPAAHSATPISAENTNQNSGG